MIRRILHFGIIFLINKTHPHNYYINRHLLLMLVHDQLQSQVVHFETYIHQNE
jgi:hypothetical protein